MEGTVCPEEGTIPLAHVPSGPALSHPSPTDLRVHPCLWVCHQREGQQHHDHAAGAYLAAQQVQGEWATAWVLLQGCGRLAGWWAGKGRVEGWQGLPSYKEGPGVQAEQAGSWVLEFVPGFVYFLLVHKAEVS